MAEALLQAIGQSARRPTGWDAALDLCGGTGHLTRVLTGLGPADSTVLADLFFWKLWLAKRFTSPGCEPVCCDANQPLPFARDAFSLVVLADAFPYIWHKRLLAEEMMRLCVPDGVVVMPHLHSALGENFSAGNTLTPAAYRDLFTARQPRLFSDELSAHAGAGAPTGGSDARRIARRPRRRTVTHAHCQRPCGSVSTLRAAHGADRDGRAQGESSVPRRAARQLVDPHAHVSHARIRGRVRRMPAVPARHGDGGCGSDRHDPAGNAGITAATNSDAGASSSTRHRITAEPATASEREDPRRNGDRHEGPRIHAGTKIHEGTRSTKERGFTKQDNARVTRAVLCGRDPRFERKRQRR